MSLLYKPDWVDAQKHFKAWWDGKSLGRPAFAVCAPSDQPHPFPALPASPHAQPEPFYLDADRRLDEQESWIAGRAFLGEMFPKFSLDLGPGSLAIYLGCQPGFAWDTIWFEPCLDPANPESAALPVFDPDNRWWRTHLELVRRGAERARGKCFMTVPDLVEGLDILAAQRGPQELLTDLYDRPEWVHRWLERLADLYFEYFDRIYDVVKDPAGGNTFTAFQVWAPGRMAKLQCDFSYMIGPDMFAEFVAPDLAKQCRRLDYAVYHLDGQACIPHVQHLVKIDRLNAIQWTPGAGQPGLGDSCWYDLYHQVRAGGKSLLLLGVEMEKIRALLREFGPDGLFIMPTRECESEAAARDLLKRVEDWSV